MNIDIRKISESNQQDIFLPNEPFELRGRLIVSRVAEKWHYRKELTTPVEMIFPDETYDYGEVTAKGFVLGAYLESTCVGLAIMEDDWMKHMYLADLKVSQLARRLGIGQKLITEAFRLAKERNYQGIYTIGQDNNLNACEFYLKVGFEIGGLNTRGYQYTAQEEKSDIYFYLS